jgi:hypothetical protein
LPAPRWTRAAAVALPVDPSLLESRLHALSRREPA